MIMTDRSTEALQQMVLSLEARLTRMPKEHPDYHRLLHELGKHWIGLRLGRAREEFLSEVTASK
jgi:hypothetical protein